MPQKIKKGDMVEVIAGRNKGEKGRVLEVSMAEGKVRVEGVFVQKRHVRAGARQNMPNGGVSTFRTSVSIPTRSARAFASDSRSSMTAASCASRAAVKSPAKKSISEDSHG
jgi:ribosomal protein L24